MREHVGGYGMETNLDFSAVKYLGEEDVFRLDQVKMPGEFEGSDLEMFNPIRAHEVFEIEIALDLDPMKVLEHLRFDNEDAPDAYDADQHEYPVDWIRAFDFETNQRAVSRFAILIQGGQLWKIAGVRCGDDLRLVLADPEETYEPHTRYYSDRVLGDFSYHSDGPGPMSWDGGSALLELDSFWLLANGGDTSAKDRIIELGNQNFGSAYLEWLLENSAQVIFILTQVKCEWEDPDQSEIYAQLVSGIQEVILFRCELNSLEVEEVLAAILASDVHDKELINVLRSPIRPLAPALMKILETVIDNENAGFLLWSDGFVGHLETLMN
jgi:hypothetical protein